MKAFRLFVKSVKEQLREPLMLAVTVMFGAIFMLIFGLAFGENYYTYSLAVRNLDQPAGGLAAGEELVAKLGDASYEDGVKLFKIEPVGSDDGVEGKLQKRDLYAYIEIPASFSATVAAMQRGEAAERVSVTVKGDPGNAGFGLVRMMLESVLDDFLAGHGRSASPVSLATAFLETKSKGGGEFTYIAPGLMLMAIFLLLIQCAMIIVKEVQTGAMLRLRVSRMKTWEFLAGISASQVLFAAVMLPLMYGMAVLVGFKGSGSLATAYLVGVCASIVAIVFGLVTAAVSRTVVEAFIWGNLVTIPVVFMSGCFFPIPEHVLFTAFGHKITLMDWLPSYPAVTAMNKVLLYGASLADVAGDILVMLLMSALLFALGVFLFSRTHLRRI